MPSYKRKIKETAKWELLFKRYDYDIKNVSWRTSRTWFLEELDQLLKSFFDEKGKQISPGEYYRLIQAIFHAAFNENKSEGTVKVAVHRIRKKHKHPR